MVHVHVSRTALSQISRMSYSTYTTKFTLITHIKNFKVVETVVDGLKKALGEKVLHGLLEELGWLRLEVLDDIILLHEGMQVGQRLHVVLSIARVHIKLIRLKGGSEKRRGA